MGIAVVSDGVRNSDGEEGSRRDAAARAHFSGPGRRGAARPVPLPDPGGRFQRFLSLHAEGGQVAGWNRAGSARSWVDKVCRTAVLPSDVAPPLPPLRQPPLLRRSPRPGRPGGGERGGGRVLRRRNTPFE
jgi:hypothetical protein